MLVSIRNTFLDTEVVPHDSRRAKSAGPLRPSRQCLSNLEQATVDSLNGLMEKSPLGSPSGNRLTAVALAQHGRSSRRCPTGWDGEKMCGIFTAGDRARWVVENTNLSLYEAQLRVMREFPTDFGRPRSLSNSFLSSACPSDWDGEEFCRGKSAKDRVEWLLRHKGMPAIDAQVRVMQEFPMQFGLNRSKFGRPALQTCTASTCLVHDVDAKSRMGLLGLWHAVGAGITCRCWDCGMPSDDVQEQVRGMREFPKQFGCERPAAQDCTAADCLGQGGESPEGWDGEIQCGIFNASARASWVVEHCGSSLYEARLRVMREFPSQFGRKRSLSNCSLSTVCPEDWDSEVFCLGRPAKDRVDFCVQHRGMSRDVAQLRVMQCFPTQFSGNHRGVAAEESPSLEQAPLLKRCLSSSTLSATGPEDLEGQEFCDGDTAADSTDGSVDTPGLTLAAARARVAQEFSKRGLQSEEQNVDVQPEQFHEEEAQAAAEAGPTTMMIRNVPYRYEQQELLEELEEFGFEGTFDFFFVPKDFGSMRTMGYAFINFIDVGSAMRCQKELEGYMFTKHQQTRKKVATVSVAHLQGLQANIDHYEQSGATKRAIAKRCMCGPTIRTNLRKAPEVVAASDGGN